eukprot:TRINITY_DN40002_c0_g1_i1.p1 TRINITY_DN40002_c0_g1~~TRINITY_DN40002_c0_g1_i1.p1  ORF type:complete len:450 (+),score=115.62 TRINITY_DN40002_c0_g1_i1:60-1352(+)
MSLLAPQYAVRRCLCRRLYRQRRAATDPPSSGTPEGVPPPSSPSTPKAQPDTAVAANKPRSMTEGRTFTLATKGPQGSPVPYTGNPDLVSDQPGYMLSGKLGTTGTTGNWVGGADLESEAILRTRHDGNTDVVSKPVHPAAPTAHFEGGVLDFSDSVAHQHQANPFGDLAEEASQGKWGGVSPHAIAIPRSSSAPSYGFERRGLRSELARMDPSMQGGVLPAQDMDSAFQLEAAVNRLPGFDPTRKALFDGAQVRKWREDRDLRRLEAESVWHRHNINQAMIEMQKGVARDSRRVTVRDAVMQNPFKWLQLKNQKHKGEIYMQNEDQRHQDYTEGAFMLFATIALGVWVTFLYIDAGTLDIYHRAQKGQPGSVCGSTNRMNLAGSYKDIGELHRFQDKVNLHMQRMQGHHVNGIIPVEPEALPPVTPEPV